MLQGLVQGNFAKEVLHFFKLLVILFRLKDKFLNLNVKFQNFCVNYVLGFLSKKMIGNNNGCNGFHGENGHSGKRNITVSKNILRAYTLFFYKNIFYKNIKADICEILRIF